jgi:myo-inositol 2-dehydrogenase/D-chiro-inositol 1-dehydrogenase
MNPLRIGLVGSGMISYAHAPAWQALGAEVVVWGGRGAAALAEAFGFRVASSYEHLLASSEIVDICTPTHTHAPLALQAIQTHRHVICEKPLARTAADARTLIDAADAHRVHLYPAHVVRYFPAYAVAREAVVAGLIGDPTVLNFARGGAAPSNDWFFDVELSGGIIVDLLVHDIDQARWIAGEVESVTASVRSAAQDSRMLVAHVVLTHRSGASSVLQGSWGPADVEFATSFDIAGSTGSLGYDSSRAHEFTASLGADATVEPSVAGFGGGSPFELELRDFARAIAGGPPPRASAHDGLAAVAIAEAALEAANTGLTVRPAA